MDDSNAEAHASLGYALMAYDWDWSAAEREFRRALDLNPGYATGHHWYAHYLLAMNRMDEAMAEMRKAWERDPLSLSINAGVGWSFYLARRYDEAIEQYRKMLEMESRFALARCMLGMAYGRKRMYPQAITQFQQALADVPESAFALTGLGQTYAASGNRADALRVQQQLAQLSKSRYVPAVYSAGIYAALGDSNQLFAWLSKSFGERSYYLIYLNVDPSMDAFRTDPRFLDLVRRVGLSK